MTLLTKIILKDGLGEKFLPLIEAEINNPKEAIDFLCCRFPDFKAYILSRPYHYSITCVGENWQKTLTPKTPNYPLFPISGKTIIIEEVLEGSGGDFFNRYFSPLLFIGISLLAGNTALLIGGLVQGLKSILFGYPPKEDEEKRSVNFQGGSPRTQEGTPIPIAIGSQVKVKDVMILSYDIVSEFTSL